MKIEGQIESVHDNRVDGAHSQVRLVARAVFGDDDEAHPVTVVFSSADKRVINALSMLDKVTLEVGKA